MKKAAIIISPNWHDYAEKYLAECLEGVCNQTWTGETKIFLIDNETSEKSFNLLKQIVNENPSSAGRNIEIIRNEKNDGFAKGNNVAMKAAVDQGYDYIILFNMDTIVEGMAVEKMIEAAEKEESIGAVQAKLLLYPEKEKINSIGNATHFLGFGYCLGYNENDVPSHYDSLKDIFYPSGAAVLLKRTVLEKTGLFDEEFWMYNEDQDLGWRIWLTGYRCVLAPEAVVFHKYEFSRSISKYYWMDRNRLIVILKNYHFLTFLLITPALLLMEIGLLLFAFKGGWLKQKLKIYAYFLNLKNLNYVLSERKSVQNKRKIKDKKLISLISDNISYQEIESPALKIANIIFSTYWRVINKIIIW